MSDDNIEYFKDNYGLLPTAQYHIASPGYYGYGGYGSDWDATFYILDDDKGVQLSQYAGEETYSQGDQEYRTQDSWINYRGLVREKGHKAYLRDRLIMTATW